MAGMMEGSVEHFAYPSNHVLCSRWSFAFDFHHNKFLVCAYEQELMSQRNVPHAYLCVHDDLCDDWYVSSTVLSKNGLPSAPRSSGDLSLFLPPFNGGLNKRIKAPST